MHAWLPVRSSLVTNEKWAHYVRALTDNQSELAEKVGVAQSTVSRWFAGGVPSPQQVIAVARAYGMSAVDALVEAGYLTREEVTFPAARPRALSLREFSDRELALETLRRIDSGRHPELDEPMDAAHPAVREHATNVRPVRDTSDIDEPSILTAEELHQRDLDLAAHHGSDITAAAAVDEVPEEEHDADDDPRSDA